METLLSCLPVDHIPDGAEVLCLAVLVLQVVGVFPCVNSEDRAELADNRVLVRIGADLKRASLGILYKPGPAGSLDACQSSVHLLFQRVEGAEVRVDRLGKRAGRGVTTALRFRRKVLPEERVIGVAA